jgi:cytochrome bd ubiquinol oxidase subunit I
VIWGEKRLGPRNHFLSAVAVALGSWTSGYSILVTNAFMQHPAGYETIVTDPLVSPTFGAYLLNPWALIQFAHN